MLTIRQAQSDALAASLQRRFEDRFTAALPGELPDQLAGADEAEVRRMVREGMDEAFGYGIESASGLNGWLHLRVVHGPGFEKTEERAWALRILVDPDLPGDAKVAFLESRLGQPGPGEPPP